VIPQPTVALPEEAAMSATFVATPLRGPVSLRVPFAATSAGEARHALGVWMAHQGFGDRVVDDAQLVVSELVGNAVRHASPLPNGALLVRWRRSGRLLELSVCDGGGSTAPARVIAAPDQTGGRGLAIVEALSDTWWVERTPAVHAVHARLGLA
jgi:anti-sigma regulatory factor (Ser/Thr protein kinase)